MVPNINLNELLWAYAPGLVPAGFIYLGPMGGELPPVFANSKGGGDGFVVLYFIVMPMVIGVSIDALRHGFSLLNQHRWPFWKFEKDCPIVHPDYQHSDALMTYVLTRTLVFYSLYEFFFDLAIGLAATAIAVLLFDSSQTVWVIWLFLVALLAFVLSQIYPKMRDHLVRAHLTATDSQNAWRVGVVIRE